MTLVDDGEDYVGGHRYGTATWKMTEEMDLVIRAQTNIFGNPVRLSK